MWDIEVRNYTLDLYGYANAGTALLIYFLDFSSVRTHLNVTDGGGYVKIFCMCWILRLVSIAKIPSFVHFFTSAPAPYFLTGFVNGIWWFGCQAPCQNVFGCIYFCLTPFFVMGFIIIIIIFAQFFLSHPRFFDGMGGGGGGVWGGLV